MGFSIFDCGCISYRLNETTKNWACFELYHWLLLNIWVQSYVIYKTEK